MPFNTLSVATAVTPSVIETYLSHYFNRGPLRQKPTAHISYHEGLRLIRRFLEYSSLHTIEDIQGFTAQWVPAPSWCRIQSVEIPPQFLERSAKVLRSELGSLGTRLVGGEKWWQWRRPESALHAEWIEMKKDFNERKRLGVKCDRVILYVHGGAYYFGSVDEHRYQMQRHARKLKARVLAPRYRLSPQFPFPCGLHDCIATYFYLLEHFPPNQILFAGDSAGGGMVISMLVTLRDQGLPLPAGAILLSPWVDLTHSFPSVSGDGPLDYIPPMGFHHRPSLAWPPPPLEPTERKFTQPIEQAFDVVELPATDNLDLRSPIHGSIDSETASMRSAARRRNTPNPMNRNLTPGLGDKLEIEIDDKKVLIKEQIQMYAPNHLLTHPLVSPVQQPSLGGLPPLLIQVGGGELLRDEQIYLAHKAADPKNFPPCDAILDDFDPRRATLKRYPPTNVQLQVWEDLCHVPHTLSFTRPAKYMFRAVAQFGAWALAHAQPGKAIDIPANTEDDAISVISTGSQKSMDGAESISGDKITKKDTFGSIGDDGVTSTQIALESTGAVGRAGDMLPDFEDHMIRQRVNRHGLIFPLPAKSEIASLHLDPATIGAIKPGPVRKWLAKRAEMDKRFEKEYKRVAKKREKEQALGYDPIEEGEDPPLTAMYRRRRGGTGPEIKKRGKSWGLALWSGWGAAHDENTLDREAKVVEEKQKEQERAASQLEKDEASGSGGGEALAKGGIGASRTNLAVPGEDPTTAKKARRISASSRLSSTWSNRDRDPSRPRTPYTKVVDAGQADGQEAGGSRTPQQQQERTATGFGSAFGLRRKSSAASSKAAQLRPISGAAPIPVMPPINNGIVAGSDSPQLPGTPRATVAAPNMSDTNKEAVKVPGSENTYLNPNSSRPHNGTVAYPFKLQHGGPGAPSPNPSTMTLEDYFGGDGPTELPAGGEPAAIELPTGVASSFPASSTTSATAAPLPAHDFLSTEPSSLPGSAGASPSDSRPISEFPENTNLGHLRSPEEDPVSPQSALALASANSSPPVSSFQPKHNKFESRDSRIGNLGHDGMPITAPFALGSVLNGSTSSAAPAAAPTSLSPLRTVSRNHDPHNEQLHEMGSSSPIAEYASSRSSPTAAPFKLRNPSPDPAQFANTTTTTTLNNVPFRLRNTNDLSPSTASPPSSSSPGFKSTPPTKPPPSGPLPSPPSARSLASRPSASNLSAFPPAPAPLQIVRPMTRDSDVPPTPPPKDDVLPSPPLGHGGDAARRPPLETFVTASEGLDFPLPRAGFSGR